MTSIRLYLVAVLLSTICIASFLAVLRGYQESLARANLLLDRQLEDTAALLDMLQPGPFGPVVTDEWALRVVPRGATDDVILPDMKPGYHDMNFEGRRWRVLVRPARRDDLVILVGHPLRVYRGLTEEIVLVAVQPIVLVVPLLGVLVWIIVGAGLSPLKRLVGALRARRADDLDAIEPSGYPAELQTVIRSLNHLFERLNDAYLREKRLTADAAHELRTPVAALKIQIHNLEQERGASEDSNELKSSVDRISHAIAQILTINRLNPDTFRDMMSRVDLRAIAEQVLADCDTTLLARNQQIDLDAQRCDIWGESTSLAILLRNLIDNASRYSPTGSPLRVALREDGSCVEIRVDDAGPGIPAEERDRVLDRFYRGPNQHLATGSGLGLAIVADVVHLHGGTLVLDDSPLGGLQVRVRLPRQQGCAR